MMRSLQADHLIFCLLQVAEQALAPLLGICQLPLGLLTGLL